MSDYPNYYSMDTKETDLCCWYCCDFKIIFGEALNVIIGLKAKNMTIDQDTILVKLMEVHSPYTSYLLDKVLAGKSTLKNEFTSEINIHFDEEKSSDHCRRCGQDVSSFHTLQENVMTGFKGVDRTTFDVLASDFNEFKLHVDDFIAKVDSKTIYVCEINTIDTPVINTMASEDDDIAALKEENKKLTSQITENENMINLLLNELDSRPPVVIDVNAKTKCDTSRTHIIEERKKTNRI